MGTLANNAVAGTRSINTEPSDIASASVPDTLATLHVNPDTGLTRPEVEVRRKEHGYNEVTEQKEHPVRKFLGKFLGDLSMDAQVHRGRQCY